MRRLALLLASLALVVGAAACGGSEDETATPETVEGTVATTEPSAPAEGDPANGEELYAANGCGGCHVFEPAGSSGSVGPNLDDSGVSFEDAVNQIKNGGGGMPAFGDRLSDEEVADVAAFVTQGN
jgi:mono/diheme cytochrome c family protein